MGNICFSCITCDEKHHYKPNKFSNRHVDERNIEYNNRIFNELLRNKLTSGVFPTSQGI
jgi:hypothetical protein